MALLDGGGFSKQPTYGPVGSALGGAKGGAALGRPAPRPAAPTPRVSSGPSGHYSAPAPPPAVQPGPMNMDPNAWLNADTSYQDMLRQLNLAATNFGADITRRQGIIGQDYGTNEQAMNTQKGLDLEALEDDWAGRGMIRSGLYGSAVGKYNTEFDRRLAELALSRDRALANLTQEQNQFNTQQELDKQAAREQALRRRASSLTGVA